MSYKKHLLHNISMTYHIDLFFEPLFIFIYVYQIQHSQNMKTHICLFLNTMPKYIHTNVNLIYSYTNIDVINMHMHIYVYT